MNSIRTTLLASSLALLTSAGCGGPPMEAPGEPFATPSAETEEAYEDTAAPATPPVLDAPREPAPEPPYREPPQACISDLSPIVFPPFPELVHPELAEQVRARNLLAVTETALSSPGDKMTLELGGGADVPVYPGLGVGGDISLSLIASVKDDEPGFELEGGANAAAAMNASAGVVGASLSQGGGLGVRWHFDTHAELVHGIRALVTVSVVGPHLEGASASLHARIDEVNALIAVAEEQRQLREQVVDWFLDTLGFDGDLVERLRELRDERDYLRRGLEILSQLSAEVDDARAFLNDHADGLRLELAATASVSAGITGIETGGSTAAVAGLKASASVDRVVILELSTLEAEPGVAADVTLSFRGKMGAAGGGLVGISTELGRKLEIQATGTVTAEGVSIDTTSPTATFALDRAFHGTVGAVLAGRYGVGRESQVKVDLDALAELGTDAFTAVITGSPEDAAEILSNVSPELSGQARIERGLMIGIGGKIGEELIGAKIYAEAVWTDAGEATSAEGLPCRGAIANVISDALDEAISDETFTLLDEVGTQVAELQIL